MMSPIIQAAQTIVGIRLAKRKAPAATFIKSIQFSLEKPLAAVKYPSEPL